ncbi:MAG TPA: aminotransferase class I/II-fold pyridoxal phosphate-dependent enzyme, partial [Candidatus Polarisedimenticolia bacterium]|nr:aminotransferase class I/II-fold pyridoxal phosphate-dependent enzyme [Candidatus Polarisedimenticolia bacterium]
MMSVRPALARRLDAISVSPTLQVMMEAKALRARGVDVIDFGPGEPDFDSPENVKRAGKAAIDANLSHYTDTSGILELRSVIAARYRDRHGADWGENDVFTGCGGK